MTLSHQTGRPGVDDASPFQHGYIDQVVGDDILEILTVQLAQFPRDLSAITEETSLQRYAPDKWSLRQVLNHLTDTERIFTFRALWIARGLDGPLVSFDQTTAALGAESDMISWAHHMEEFTRVRLATLSLFGNLPAAGWSRSGIIHDHRITARALAFMTAGHLEHHRKILHERYLSR